MLLAQLEVPAASVEAAVTLAAAAGVVTVLNPAPVRGPLPPSLLGPVAVLVANATEATALGGADAAALRVLGPSKVVVTLGAAGAVGRRARMALAWSPPFPCPAPSIPPGRATPSAVSWPLPSPTA